MNLASGRRSQARRGYGPAAHSSHYPEQQQEEKQDDVERDRRDVSSPKWLWLFPRLWWFPGVAESVTGGKHILDLVGSSAMKELCAPVMDIEQTEEYDAYHGHEQQAAMVLRQGESTVQPRIVIAMVSSAVILCWSTLNRAQSDSVCGDS